MSLSLLGTDGPRGPATAQEQHGHHDNETSGTDQITTGRGPMPPWRHRPENERWTLARYIRTLAGK
jgi:hypothetical protein